MPTSRRSRRLTWITGAIVAASALVLGVIVVQAPHLVGGSRTSSEATETAASSRAAPPPPPGLDEARSQLDGLSVEEDGSDKDYDRDLFPHWSNVEGNCDARETVLKRDGEGVEVGDDCYPTAGSWTSPFDGEQFDDPSDVTIDHFVPLKEAWDSGADDWTTDEREKFANDLDSPQLWAVSAASNQDKSDQDPAEWMPSAEDIHCDYAKSWINVKHVWKLTVDEQEKSALTEQLDSAC